MPCLLIMDLIWNVTVALSDSSVLNTVQMVSSCRALLSRSSQTYLLVILCPHMVRNESTCQLTAR